MGVIDENWNYEIDFDECEKCSYKFFELEINAINESVLKALDYGFVNAIEGQDSLTRSNDDDFKLLIETNRELKQEIDSKLKSLTQQQIQYENYKQDQKLFQQEIKETHEAFLLARKHYKKCLNFYYTIESKNNENQTVFVQFFTDLKKNGENYSVNLLKNMKTKQFTLQSATPTVRNFKELQRILKETNDVPGLLCCIRQYFIALKKNKEI